jgi:hypothetical protein
VRVLGVAGAEQIAGQGVALARMTLTQEMRRAGPVAPSSSGLQRLQRASAQKGEDR